MAGPTAGGENRAKATPYSREIVRMLDSPDLIVTFSTVTRPRESAATSPAPPAERVYWIPCGRSGVAGG